MELETPALRNACVAGHHASLGLQAPLALLCPQSRLGFACVCRISVVLKLRVRGGSLRSHPETEAGVSRPLQTPISRSRGASSLPASFARAPSSRNDPHESQSLVCSGWATRAAFWGRLVGASGKCPVQHARPQNRAGVCQPHFLSRPRVSRDKWKVGASQQPTPVRRTGTQALLGEARCLLIGDRKKPRWGTTRNPTTQRERKDRACDASV